MSRKEYHYMVAVEVVDGKVTGSVYVDGESTPTDNVFNLDTEVWERGMDEGDVLASEYLAGIIERGMQQ